MILRFHGAEVRVVEVLSVCFFLDTMSVRVCGDHGDGEVHGRDDIEGS